MRRKRKTYNQYDYFYMRIFRGGMQATDSRNPFKIKNNYDLKVFLRFVKSYKETRDVFD